MHTRLARGTFSVVFFAAATVRSIAGWCAAYWLSFLRIMVFVVCAHSFHVLQNADNSNELHRRAEQHSEFVNRNCARDRTNGQAAHRMATHSTILYTSRLLRAAIVEWCVSILITVICESNSAGIVAFTPLIIHTFSRCLFWSLSFVRTCGGVCAPTRSQHWHTESQSCHQYCPSFCVCTWVVNVCVRIDFNVDVCNFSNRSVFSQWIDCIVRPELTLFHRLKLICNCNELLLYFSLNLTNSAHPLTQRSSPQFHSRFVVKCFWIRFYDAHSARDRNKFASHRRAHKISNVNNSQYGIWVVRDVNSTVKMYVKIFGRFENVLDLSELQSSHNVYGTQIKRTTSEAERSI